jgi:hypothetical protein
MPRDNWDETKRLALDDLRERWSDGSLDLDEPHDTIHEIADSSVPVYNADRMTVAADPEVWGRDVDQGLFGGETDLMHIVAVYIYDALNEALWEEVERIKEEAEEADEEEEEDA